jgi:signal transduction histidine kinase
MVIDVPDAPVLVRIDVQGYHYILSNLVSNAVKYTLAGAVEVILRRAEPWAVLEVRDTGIGIPKEEIPKLFTEFFRATNARLSQMTGTGVGLAGVKELVERFGGELELESQVGKGSLFIVRLPLHTA